jgi:anti-anti-sigma factor
MTSVDLISTAHCDEALRLVVLGGDPLQLQLVGDLDVVNADATLSVVTSHAAAGQRVVLDLHRLTFIDTAGVRALEKLAHLLEGGELVITNPSPMAHRLLALTGVGARSHVRLDSRLEQVAELLPTHPAGRD